MVNVHQIMVKWSRVKIDTDKDMNKKSLENLNRVDYTLLVTENAYVLRKSPGRHQIRIETPYGFMDIGPDNAYFSHFHTDRTAFYFNEDVVINGNVRGYKDKIYDLGLYNVRWRNALFAGNLGLGVIKEPGTNLAIDIIYETAYSEVASYLDETNTSVTTGWADDWDIGTLDTYTDNGIITGVKLQFDYNNYSSSDDWQYRLLEDGVEVLSFTLPANATGTLSGEYTTLKQSAEYKTQINSTLWQDGNWKIKNRYLYFKKRYLGIKAGS